jgi:hypothetical protein
MSSMTHPSTFDYPRTEQQAVRDLSWYGTVALLAGCVVLLAAAFFVG